MSMGDISPEDRERLVDVRFGELFSRHMERGFADAFDRRLMEWAEIAGGSPSQSQPPRATPTRPLPPTNEPQQRQRRRSLLEISMSDLLGIG